MTHDLNTGGNTCDFRTGRRKYKIVRCLVACVLAGLISGCAITQDFLRPHVDIPHNWRVDYQTAADFANTAWWEQFQDPVLNELIKNALNENRDLRIAVARVEEFAGKLQAVQAGFYPQINYGGSASQDYQSRSLPIPQIAGSVDRLSPAYKASLSVSWELDVWGRVRRATEAARADLLSAEESRQAVILTLVADVADGYVTLLGLDKLLLTARKTMATQEDLLHLFERKFEGGLVSGLELSQVRSSYEKIAEFIPDIERKIALQENALSVLLGRNPGTIKRCKTLDTLVLPEIPQGIPSDLLIRRPDIRQSEQNLIAASARIGVARTQYFPTISLTGLFGYSSDALTLLLQDSANFWQIGAGVLGPIFTGGRIKGEVRQAEAKQQQLLNAYLSTIQTAFREVDDSLVTIRKQKEMLKIQARHINALKDNVYFARARYDAKFASYINVVDAERNLFNAEIDYVRTQGNIFAGLVSNYKAMGGGWVREADKLISRPGLKPEPAGQTH
jgi:outer membrane protein, multidrug efflux system